MKKIRKDAPAQMRLADFLSLGIRWVGGFRYHWVDRFVCLVPVTLSFNYSNLSSIIFALIANAALTVPLLVKKAWHLS